MDYFWFTCVKMHCSYCLFLWFKPVAPLKVCYLPVCVLNLYCGGIPGLATPWVLPTCRQFGLELRFTVLCFVFLALRWVSWDCLC